MKLNIPEQNAASVQSTPGNPRKLRKLLLTLPNASMGEATKQTFHILRDQNRQTMPIKHRLENLEMLREHARKTFDNLKKYFINRTLPLPDKSLKIVNLNQSMLQELIYGYEIIAYEAASQPGAKIDDKTLSIAICRAIKYLAELFLRSSEVYEPSPKNLWYDIHQLYLFAESKKLTGNIVNDIESIDKQTSIENCYKQIILFALARPIALRQSDSERVFKELYHWASHASIHLEASEQSIDNDFCMRVNEDTAPDYLTRKDLEDNVTIRLLNASKLVSHIKELIAEKETHKQKITVGDDIPLETLKVLASSWSKNVKRRFSRAERSGHINVAIGLTRSAKAIRDSYNKKDENIYTRSGYLRTSESKHEPDFTLTTIDTNKSKRDRSGSRDIENDAWNMVAQGRVLTEAYVKEKHFLNEDQLASLSDIDPHWDFVNISAGGYRLRWNSDETSKAQIGELIALQEFDTKNNFEWRVGVIRWMQFTREHGLEIGIQVISPKVVAATAQRVNRLDEAPFECLMLPGIKALNQTSSTLLPAHAFKTNDKLVVQILENKLTITLGDTKEHTGSFTQFTYKNADEDQRIRKQAKKEDATKNQDDFDELWSSL